jgi:hypothetical protein
LIEHIARYPALMRALSLLLLVACDPKSEVVDADGDGFNNTEDCDDANALAFPDASEVCDGIDNDCDGTIDNDPTDGTRYYADADGDGYGDPLSSQRTCVPTSGAVTESTDCDDTQSTVHPGAEEVCDGLDNDCDNAVDEDITETLTFYADADGDGYGDPDSALLGCAPTSGMVENADDCNDSDYLTSPGAAETWYDGIDQDCAGGNDYDADLDGFEGDGGDDCDDTEPTTNPGAAEVCSDGIDNDCDGGAGSCGISGNIAAGDADMTFTGSTQSYAGISVDGAGDVDGDGVNEIIIGAYGANSFSGAAYIIDGTSTGSISSSNAVTLSGPSGYSYAGYAVAGAGDVDGDGFDDVLVGASYSGTSFLAYGPLTNDMDLEDAGWAFTEDSGFSYAGLSVDGLGDIDGDGLDDIIIGSPYNSEGGNYAGAAYIALGGGELAAGGGELDLADAEAAIFGEIQAQYVGHSVSGAGDVNGDGLDDVLVGAGGQAAQSYIFLGPVAGEQDVQDADVQITSSSNNFAGRAVSGAGDTNSDGYDDVIIGAYYNNNGTGAAYLFRGPLITDQTLSGADATMTGEATNSYAGYSVSDAGDIDGDGGSDLLIGAPYASASSGRAYLVSGATTGTLSLADADAILSGNSGYSWMGAALAGPGDVSGDGFNDILIGSHYASSYAGNAYLFLGGGM